MIEIEGSTPRSSPDFDSIRAEVYARSPGESVWVPKSEMPRLPQQFDQTVFGTPLWIAHPGSTAQHRATPAMHAYEMDDGWSIHRDVYDRKENPLGHFFSDAPELPMAVFAAVATSVLAWLLFDEKEREKDEAERNPWIPIAVAVGLAVLVGILVCVIAALARVHFGVG